MKIAVIVVIILLMLMTVLLKKAREKYPTGWLVTFRINETGAC